MMAISANGIGNIDIKTDNASKSQKDDNKATDAFASLLNMTSVKVDANTDFKSDKNVVATDTKIKVDKYTASMSKTQTDKTVADKDVASAVVSDIKDAIKDALGVSDEKLEKMLSDFGIDITDLLDVNTLKEFVLDVNNSTEVDLLINEDLSNLLDDITGSVMDILKDYSLEDVNVDELIDTLKDFTLSDISDDTQVIEPVIVGNEIESDVDADTEVIKSDEDVDISIVREDAGGGVKETDYTVSSDGTPDNSSDMNGNSQSTENPIITNINQAINDAMQIEDVDTGFAYSDAIEQADIVRQVIDSIKVNISKENTSITVQLNPENLGKVQVSVANRNGIMQAQIVAETESARHAIENSIAVLKETFDNHELKVDAVEVMVAPQDFFNNGNREDGFNENNQNKTSQGTSKLNINEDMDEDELSEDDKLAVTMMKAQGNSVSYSI